METPTISAGSRSLVNWIRLNSSPRTRAIALANLLRTEEARAELAAFDELAAQVPEDWLVGTNEAGVVHSLARQVALGEILFKEGRVEESFAVLKAAAAEFLRVRSLISLHLNSLKRKLKT